jgi:hypothetical protein
MGVIMDPIVIGLVAAGVAVGFVLGTLRARSSGPSGLIFIAKLLEALSGVIPVDDLLNDLADRLPEDERKMAYQDVLALDQIIERIKTAVQPDGFSQN